MRMTRQRMILAAVLAVAGAALLIDRVLLGGGATAPQAADAAAVAPDTATGDIDKVLDQIRRSLRPTLDGQTISQRLDQASERLGLSPDEPPNAFVPHESWAELLVSAGPAGGGSQPQTPAQRFAADHVLEAVMLSEAPGGGMATLKGVREPLIINGKPVPDTQFRLVAVMSDKAVFSDGTEVVELKLPDPFDKDRR